MVSRIEEVGDFVQAQVSSSATAQGLVLSEAIAGLKVWMQGELEVTQKKVEESVAACTAEQQSNRYDHEAVLKEQNSQMLSALEKLGAAERGILPMLEPRLNQGEAKLKELEHAFRNLASVESMRLKISEIEERLQSSLSQPASAEAAAGAEIPVSTSPVAHESRSPVIGSSNPTGQGAGGCQGRQEESQRASQGCRMGQKEQSTGRVQCRQEQQAWVRRYYRC